MPGEAPSTRPSKMGHSPGSLASSSRAVRAPCVVTTHDIQFCVIRAKRAVDGEFLFPLTVRVEQPRRLDDINAAQSFCNAFVILASFAQQPSRIHPDCAADSAITADS
jgi:hypothetical protein